MFVRRLSWAGIEAFEGSCRILVDPLEDTRPLRGFLGSPRSALVPVPTDEQTWALVTHLHADHCDRNLLARLLPQHVLCSGPVAATLNDAGISAIAVDLWDKIPIGPLRVIPVPSHDWRGDDQVAWIIESDTRRVIHAGDTIWHGRWYEIARRHAPFDVAFLPINGVIARLEGFTPTEVPATLTPEQAIEAALVLSAGTACAIHHTLFHNPPRYAEQPRVVERFLAAARRRGINATAPSDGSGV